MKKIIFKVLLLALLAGSVLGLLGIVCEPYMPLTNSPTWLPKDVPEDIDLAVIGSSHSMFGLDFTPYSDKYFNFSISAQTAQYDYRILNEYKDKINRDAIVLLTVSYMSPYRTDSQENFDLKQFRYYKILSFKNIVEPVLKDYIIEKSKTNSLTARLLLTNIPDLITEIKYSRTPSEPASSGSEAAHWYDEENLPRMREHVLFHQSLITPAFPDGNPDMLQAYEDLFALAEEKNWRVILITTPFPDIYSEMFDDEFYASFYNHVNSLAAEYNVPYWDYSHHPDFMQNYELFKDVDHLNSAGKELLSQLVYDRMISEGFIE